MQLESIKSLFNTHKETNLHGRYIHSKSIEELIFKYSSNVKKEIIGKSVLNESIYAITVGKGPIKVLLWSQMHGNESTTTKALFDVLNVLDDNTSGFNTILEACTLKIVPILNPDGALKYTRENANGIDLNRDAQELSQPESVVLRRLFDDFKPNYCFNLHGQRTIFSAGNTNNPATLSFLAPAQDSACRISENRKQAMALISSLNVKLQKLLTRCIGIYDDSFNINCVGDTFQSLGVPTLLFEAGHFPKDYQREVTREFIFIALILALEDIASQNKLDHNGYFNIPENQKLFYDIIIRNVIKSNNEDNLIDVAIQYHKELIDGTIRFLPKNEKTETLPNHFGHREGDGGGKVILTEELEEIFEGYDNDFVILDNERLSLKLANR